MNDTEYNTRTISTVQAIWFMLKLQFFRTRNKITQGHEKKGLVNFLGMLFLLLIIGVFVSQFSEKLIQLEEPEKGYFLLSLQLSMIGLFFGSEFSFNAKDAGSTEKDTEWLMTLPIQMSTISLMKIARIALLNGVGTMLLLPTIAMLTFYLLGWQAVFFVILAVYIPMVFSLATLIHLLDMSIGLLLRPKIRKYINFLSSVIVFFSYISLYVIHYSLDNEEVFQKILVYGKNFSFMDWNPVFVAFSLPILYQQNPSLGLTAFLWFLLGCLLIVGVCGILINKLATRGFREKSEAIDRGQKIARTLQPKGIWGKEILLLVREKRLWFSLLLPVFMIAINHFVNGIEITTTKDVILQGFLVGLWVPLSAIPVLAIKEKGSMWLTFTFPKTLSQQLFQKMLFWSIIAAIVSLSTIVGYLIIFEVTFSLLYKIMFVPVFIFCISSIFYGLRLGNLDYQPSLGNDSLKKTGLGMMYLLIGSGYFAIYSDDVLQTFVTLFLFVFLAATLWQKYSIQFPHLLDDGFKPRLEIALEHGIMAVIAFFVLQSVIVFALIDLNLSKFPIVIGFGIAGFIVYAISAFYFWYNKAKDTAKIFGFQKPKSWFLAAKQTLFFAGLALIVRLMYQPVINYLQALVDETAVSVGEFTEYAMGAIFLAPIFEEIIFRGMVYGGLRKDRGILVSVLLSALLFTIVHPTISWPPVFALGVCCAYAYERTESLLSPILIHFLFNVVAIVLSLDLVSG